MRKKSFFLFYFSEFFRILSKIFSDFWPKNFKNLWKLTSSCPQEQLVALNFLKKFLTVLDFLQKPLAWFSKFYLRVQMKIWGRNIFLIFPSEFCGFWAKNFSDFWPKNFKNLSKLPSTCPEEQFVAWSFFKFWIVSNFLQKLLAWFSKFFLRVQSKNCGKNRFFCFLPRIFFRILSKSFSDFWPKNFKKFSKLPTCPEE